LIARQAARDQQLNAIPFLIVQQCGRSGRSSYPFDDFVRS